MYIPVCAYTHLHATLTDYRLPPTSEQRDWGPALTLMYVDWERLLGPPWSCDLVLMVRSEVGA